MRTYFLCAVLGCAFFVCAAEAQQWQWLNPAPQGNMLVGMAVPEGDTLRFFSDWGLAAERSTAGWTVPPPDGNLYYTRGYSFINARQGWAVQHRGEWGRILATTDGGHSWTEQFRVDNGEMGDVFFWNANLGWAVGTDWDAAQRSLLLRTTDGGQSWLPGVIDSSATSSMSAVEFISELEGWALAAWQMYHTTDGGVTWERWRLTGQYLSRELDFENSLTGWAIGGGGYDLYKTTDGGHTWAAEDLNPVGYQGVTAVAVLSESRVWAVGDSGQAWVTQDGGQYWTSYSVGSRANLTRVMFTDLEHGWILGAQGTVLATTNGFGWEVVAGNPETEYTYIWDIDFFDREHGWATSDVIRYSSDGGESWTVQTSPSGPWWDLSIVDLDHVWAAGSNGVMHTTNGGQDWIDLTVEWAWGFREIHAITDSVVWAVANDFTGSAVWRTTNGGANWRIETGLETGETARLFALDADNAWLCGGYWETWGKVLHTTDGGLTWEEQGENLPFLNAIYFLDAQHGWVAGAGAPAVFRTTDGGATWVPQGSEYEDISDLHFFDELHGWALSGHGTSRTTDGGETWEYVPSQADTWLSRMDFTDMNHGWLCGWHGTIMRYTDETSPTPEPARPQPSAFALSCYPNPFNAITQIRFVLPQRTAVRLAVFDLSGRLVETLTDAVYAAGSHALSFRGANLASGVYFARLEAGRVTHTQKLLLLK